MKTALLMYSYPGQMGVEIQHVGLGLGVNVTAIFQEHILSKIVAPAVEEIGENEKVSLALSDWSEIYVFSDFKEATDKLMRAMELAGAVVPRIEMTIQKDIGSNQDDFWDLYDKLQETLAPEEEDYEYHGSCGGSVYTVLAIDNDGVRQASELKSFAATYGLAQSYTEMGIVSVKLIDGPFDSGKAPIAEWNPDKGIWVAI